MKKIILAAVLAMFASVTAYAGPGINIGVSGQIGLFEGTASELDKGTHGTTSGTNETNKETESNAVGYNSVFIEKTLGSRAFVGFDYVPSALESETADADRLDMTTSNAKTKKVNKVQVDFKDLSTFYLGLNINENFYVKAGLTSVDIITNETLATGSNYGNTDMDGHSFGVGYNNSFDNGLFVRVEGNYMEFDGASITSDTGVNKITLDKLEGVTGKVSLGKSF